MQQLLSYRDEPVVTGENEPAGSVEDIINERLTKECPYRFYFKDVIYRYVRGTVVLRGWLPSFHLKPVLQTLLRDIEGVARIDNQVDVNSSTGLSSSGRK